MHSAETLNIFIIIFPKEKLVDNSYVWIYSMLNFEKRMISNNGAISWPVRNTYIIYLNFHLWVYIKNECTYSF